MADALSWVALVVAHAVLAAALGVAAATDLARRLIPNACPLAVCAAAALRLAARALAGEASPSDLPRALVGGAVVAGAMLAAAALSHWARGEAGVGGGDVKLLGAVGLWVGPVAGLACVALSCLLALVAHAAAHVAARALARPSRPPGPWRTEGMPLAPGIAVAALALVLAGA